MRHIFFILSIVIVIFSCKEQSTREEVKVNLETGLWRGILDIQGRRLPFNFEVTTDSVGYFVQLINGEEKLDAGYVEFSGDSVFIPMGYFDASLFGKFQNGKISGYYTKHFAEDYFIPWEASKSSERFSQPNDPDVHVFDGKWEVTFTNPGDSSSYPAIGLFRQESGKFLGTFLTPTGDYRFLEGYAYQSGVSLSTFDGEHIYLFTGNLQEDGTIKGEYFSGKGGYKTWTGFKNTEAELPASDPLTFLKEGYDRIEFSLPDVNGKLVSLSDSKYKGKVLILQIFGTWCSNCMDETKFLAPWYEANKNRGVEIIGLAFENKPDFEYASKRIRKMIEKLDVGYDFLIAGSRKIEEAGKILPMLNKVFVFPTTIYIDKTGKVRKIHSGFTGPGTGKYYLEFVENFGQFLNQLIQEDTSAG